VVWRLSLANCLEKTPKITLTCMFCFFHQSHTKKSESCEGVPVSPVVKIMVLMKNPRFHRGGSASESTCTLCHRDLVCGNFGKEGENKGWSWDVERSHWKQHDQNALATKIKVPWLPVTGMNGMEAGMSMSLTRNVLFSTWPLSFRWGLPDNKKHKTYLLLGLQSDLPIIHHRTWDDWVFGYDWIFFGGVRGLNVIQFDHSCCKIRCF